MRVVHPGSHFFTFYLLGLKELHRVRQRVSANLTPFYLPAVSENMFLGTGGEKYLSGPCRCNKNQTGRPDLRL